MSDVFKDVKINVYVDGELVKKISKIKVAPGEMESVKLDAKILKGAKERTFKLEEI